jgi:hypothetical protein
MCLSAARKLWMQDSTKMSRASANFIPKRFFVVTGFIASLIFCSSGFAAPVGCPAQPISKNFYNIPLNVGFETDYIAKRKIDNKADWRDDVDFQGFWAAGKVGYTWFERINTYFLLGGMESVVTQQRADNSKITYSSNMEFAWGWGADTLLLKTDNGISLSADMRFRRQDPGMEKVKVNTKTSRNLIGGETFREWQLSLAVAWDMSKVMYSPEKFRYVPYIGTKLSKVKVHSEANIAGIEYMVDSGRASDNYGVFLGCDIYPLDAPKNEDIGLNIEGRFIDELAFTASVNYKF